MIDIGANLGHNSFNDDRVDILERAKAAGLEHIVVTGTDLEENCKALDLVSRFPDFLSCTAGVHPHHADEVQKDAGWLDELRAQLQYERVCAIGETGLDFHRNFASHENQRRVFGMQLDLAEELAKPVFVHERDTGGEVATMLETRKSSIAGAVVHCFTGSREDLTRYLDAGFMIGITGWVCDERRGQRVRELVCDIPDDRLMIETDAPYLTPRNMPKPFPRRNEPANLQWILAQLAQLRGQDEAALGQITAGNARRLFSVACSTPNDKASSELGQGGRV